MNKVTVKKINSALTNLPINIDPIFKEEKSGSPINKEITGIIISDTSELITCPNVLAIITAIANSMIFPFVMKFRKSLIIRKILYNLHNISFMKVLYENLI